jgi:hypothetical protein
MLWKMAAPPHCRILPISVLRPAPAGDEAAMATSNGTLTRAKTAKYDEFYTQLSESDSYSKRSMTAVAVNNVFVPHPSRIQTGVQAL